MKLKRDHFGHGKGGETIFLYTLISDSGVVVKLTNYGAIITAVETPDRAGNLDNIALGFGSIEEYLTDDYIAGCPYFGCVAGRYANRVAKGKFKIDNQEYTLPVNNGPNALHGGIVGFDKVVWTGSKIEKPNLVGVSFKYRSVDGEEGYPGNLDVVVTYTLDSKGALTIDYSAETDRSTVVNLTNHTYFNLTGCKEDIKGHELTLVADTYTKSDSTLIPTGEIVSVKDTPFDFTSTKRLGDDIDDLPDGYDLNFVLPNPKSELIYAGTLKEGSSGRIVEVETTQPGIQLYTGFYIPEVKGHGGSQYGKYMGVALETQHYPDSPNRPEFPTTQLNPGEIYSERTVYTFKVK